ncbi:MAG: preprotein translocase subunit SecA [Candidatus Dormibacteraeota bacterium]|nr:preprotein translocase subunit SecA [Candidatus Dormibacteraeota bacterium]
MPAEPEVGSLMRLFGGVFNPNEREIRHHLRTAERIGEIEDDLKPLSDAELKARAELLRSRTQDESLEDLLEESFALTRVLAQRTIGMRHFDVQIVGGIVLHHGKIAEMKTGEGKTLVATLPLALNALSGEGVHLVTANDYLARRDAGWMAPVYHGMGLSTGVIVGDPHQPNGSFVYDPDYEDPDHSDPRLRHLRPSGRQEAYRCDITYGTNNQFGFDYLRDNMATDLSQRVQRKLHYGIVDEVDSILIDEARTPLIISAPAAESTDKYYQYARYAAKLEKDVDYIVELKYKSASLTEEGIAKIQRLTGIKNIYDLEQAVEAHQLNQALKAKALYHREDHYLVLNGEVVIVDEFTGRTMPGRRWSDGLHQAVEAKEGLKVQQEMRTLATITLQNYFRLYDKLAGMTGTAITEAEEFDKIYRLTVVEIPTNRPLIRLDEADVIYRDEDSKFAAVIDEIVEMNELGRPVLVGTVSVDKSERLARLLQKKGVKHNVLNAKQHEREASIVAEAGQQRAVTIATNMAGRGTDIVLGDGVQALGGLHIVGTERHESRRIDNQLRGRAGRQGDPGSTRFFISLDDQLMQVFGPAADRIGRLMDRLEGDRIEHGWVTSSIERAQRRVEGMNFDARKHVVEYDDVMNTQRELIYAEREKVLSGIDTRANILDYLREVIDRGVEANCTGRHPDRWDLEELLRYLSHYMPIAPETELPDEALNSGKDGLANYLYDAALAAYEQKEAELGDPEVVRQVERFVMLRTIDTKWVDFLTTMEHFREGISLQAYAQKDPLVEFKNEALKMFNELTLSIQGDVVASMFRVQLEPERPPPQVAAPERRSTSNGSERKVPVGAAVGAVADDGVTTGGTPAGNVKVGRNEPCWCGSGKKYKRCHGR